MGAWIETLLFPSEASAQSSHPTWVRGLKPTTMVHSKVHGKSHPTWVRGLKRDTGNGKQCFQSRTLRGCVDWNQIGSVEHLAQNRRTLRGCVDWNTLTCSQLTTLKVAPYVGAWIESKDKGTETFGIFAPPRMLHLWRLPTCLFADIWRVTYLWL